MRVLILGGDGMLGHQVFRRLESSFDVRATVHGPLDRYRSFDLFTERNTYGCVAAPGAAVQAALRDHRPEVVINCIGVVKQSSAATEPIRCIEINSLFPHQLASMCDEIGAWLIHISTDCVFSGANGPYPETSIPDPVDLYGRSKLLGEVTDSRHLTIRSSFVGPELSRKTGLYEWFCAQRGKSIKGYRRALFSGLSTLEMSRVLERLLTSFVGSSGLYHVGTEAITKFDLLMLFKRATDISVVIEPDDSVAYNRSLDSTLFRRIFGYEPPTWAEMAAELGGV